jgi:2-polyprenyl-3-methyl-5-hydroxy-6-metoxy-1,4-benzoquinol methylase
MSYKAYQGDSLDLDESSIFFTDHVSRYWWASEKVKAKDVLDCACGKGYGSFILSKNAKSVIGIDLNESSLVKCRDNFGKKENLSFVKQDAFALEFLKRKFDVITAFEVIEHLPPEKTDDFIKSLQKALKPDGILILSTPNHDVVSKSRVNIPSFHINNLKASELKDLLEKHFKNVSMLGQYKKRNFFYEIIFTLDLFNLRHSIKNLGKPESKIVVETEEEHQGFKTNSLQSLEKYFDNKPEFVKNYRFSPNHWRQAGLSVAICSN